jgi:hypothetical protein
MKMSIKKTQMKSSGRKSWGMVLILLVFVFSAIGVTPAYAVWIFANKTTANGLGSNTVNGVFASGSTVYSATDGGLSISIDGGNTFINKTTANGLGNNTVYDVFASGSEVYAATAYGLSISAIRSLTKPSIADWGVMVFLALSPAVARSMRPQPEDCPSLRMEVICIATRPPRMDWEGIGYMEFLSAVARFMQPHGAGYRPPRMAA